MDKSISLIVPARNEGARLRLFLDELASHAPHCLREVVLVLDGCTDDSAAIAARAQTVWPKAAPLRVVTRAVSAGKVAAVLDGLAVAGGRYAVLWDADGEYGLSALPTIAGLGWPETLVSGRRRYGRGWKSIAANAAVRLALGDSRCPADVLTGVHLAETAWMRRALTRSDAAGYTLETALVRAALDDDLQLVDADVPYQPRSIDEGRGVRARDLLPMLWAARKTRSPRWNPVKTSTLLAAAVLAAAALLSARPASASGSGSGSGHVTDRGRMFNPVSDPNWAQDTFPIVISGMAAPPTSENPPTVDEPPICICPTHLFGAMEVPGIGVSYWEPQYIAEVTHHPGRMLTLPGGEDILGSTYAKEFGPVHGKSGASETTGETRSQVHWYDYPVLEVVGLAISSACTNSEDGFDLASITEINPLWQGGPWAVYASPEATLFANPLMQFACIADAISATTWFPLDPLFWCAGAWGPVYPFTGNPNTQSTDQGSDALTMSKYIALNFRAAMMWDTIGPQAECNAWPSPIWVKTEFRVDPIYPHPVYGPPIYIGQSEVRWGLGPPANYPTEQDAAYLLWVARQCCLRT